MSTNISHTATEKKTIVQKLCAKLLKLFGWKGVFLKPEERKFVIIQAPHTSNWDFLVGKLWNISVGMEVNVLIKKELFFWPLGPILRSLGAEPVDRGNRKIRKTDLIVAEFERRDDFIMAITPEGTRSLSHNWKTGFYHIAKRAGVPIVMGYIDYQKKEVGTFRVFYPTDDFQKDFREIRLAYKGMGAKHPERFSVGKDLMD